MKEMQESIYSDNQQRTLKVHLSKEAIIWTYGDYWFVADKNDLSIILEPNEKDDLFSKEEFLKSVAKNNPDYAEYINSHISELLKDIDDIEDMLARDYIEAQRDKLVAELGAGGGYGDDIANSAAEKRLAYLEAYLEETNDKT